uniref:Putative zinc-finger domain-containing protein n=1 Tax=Solibacter usitatus (strain Ellin6076) TaxID=234267 RepID=Q01ND7_SOLUE
MNCADWQERIALHAGGDAEPAEAAMVEQHIGECAGCQIFWSGVKESLAVLHDVQAELPEAADFAAVRARVIGELERSRGGWRRLAWIPALAAIAVLTIVLWPSRTEIPPAPRITASIPSAPLVISPVRPRHVVTVRQEKHEPLTIRLQTSDPNIVIYWIAE